MEIRLIEPGELPEACKLIYEAQLLWPGSRGESEQEILERIQSGIEHKRLWVAYENEVMVGFGGWVSELLSHSPRPRAGENDAHLLALYASEPRKGIGTQLHQVILGDAKACGMTHMRLWTPSAVEANRLFYESLGYSSSSRSIDFKGLKRTEYCRLI